MPRQRTSKAPRPKSPKPVVDVDDEIPDPIDPTIAIAESMLKRTFETLGLSLAAVGAPGSLTVVKTPTDLWADDLSTAWGNLVHPGKPCRDPQWSSTWGNESIWTAFVGSDDTAQTRHSSDVKGDVVVAKAVWQSIPVAGFSHDPLAYLPHDLVQGADYQIEIIGPTALDLAAAAEQVTGTQPTLCLDEVEVAALTPRLLRLARRPAQSADDYIGKLRDILAREQVYATASAKALPLARAHNAPRLDTVHGMAAAVAWGQSLNLALTAYRAGDLPWADVDAGCLLSGPSGTGKTRFARALAATCQVPLLTGSYATWLATGRAHQGELLRAMRDSFAEAKKQKPAILFIDEIDSFPNRSTLRHNHSDWEIQVVNALLSELDGVEGREGVVILAACNHPELLDSALVRSGRLDRHIRVGLPDRDALERILREHLGEALPATNLHAASVAAVGMTGADCERIVRGARRRAREAGRPMTIDDLMMEIIGADSRSESELRRVAIHEAAHAVAFCLLRPGNLLGITLRASGSQGAGTYSQNPDALSLAGDIRNRLVCILAGRAGEEVLLGAPSSGSGGSPNSDLAGATKLATEAVASLGLGETATMKLVWRGQPDPTTLPRMLANDAALTAAVGASLTAAYDDALDLVRDRRVVIDKLATRLVERQALDAAEVAEIVFPKATLDVPPV